MFDIVCIYVMRALTIGTRNDVVMKEFSLIPMTTARKKVSSIGCISVIKRQ